MAGYKMKLFRGMTYDKVRPIFKREYKKVQTLFKPDKDVEEPKKKRVTEEILIQEGIKKLKAVKVSGFESTQETPSNDPKEMSEDDVQNMLEIILVSELKVEALQSLVKEKFSSAVSSVDKEKALWVELKRLFEPDADDVLWKLQSNDDLHGGQQTKEQKFGYILQVIKMIKLKKLDVLLDLKKMHLGINVAGSSITAAGLRLIMLGKVDTDAEVVEEITLSDLIDHRATRMEVIMQYGVGLEGIDITAATNHGIKVARILSRTTGNAASCAEMAIYFMLGLLRKQGCLDLRISARTNKQ
nr:D-isomer specific 2-hydroxyacid dehydrogenase, catalytic domain-containing protein [Tanacetum cinerariifolium]